MDVKYEKLTWPDVKESIEQDYIVVFPLGCTEQAGPTGALDGDTLLVSLCAIEGAKRAREKYGVKVTVLPTLPFGPAEEHMNFPGTISISFENWFAFVRDVLRSLIRHGFRRVLVVPICGGHLGIEAIVYELWANTRRSGKKDLFLEVWHDAFNIDEAAKKFCSDNGIHGGCFGKSIGLALKPEDFVGERRERITKPKYQPPDTSFWLMEDISDTGDTGDSSKASKEIGEKILDMMNEAFCQNLKKFDERTKHCSTSDNSG